MTHTAELRTETPDLQALFDQDWSSGKYRRPKCSKSDFYAGWLVAYERFKNVATVEKVAIVETPKVTARAVEPEHVTGWTPALSREWLEGVTFMDPKSEHGHKHILCGFKDRFLRLTEYNSAEWTIERKNPNAKNEWLSWDALPNYKPLPLRVARIVAARELKGLPMPEKTVTRYEGGAPLKRERPQWSGQINDNDNLTSGQAIPDSLLRKLAIKAGRPKIAP